MKRILSSLALLFAGFAMSTVAAQDIQLHYDFGRNIYTGEEAGRQKVTITVEQFKADQWGSWYYFVDVDLSRHFTESWIFLVTIAAVDERMAIPPVISIAFPVPHPATREAVPPITERAVAIPLTAF